jgi:UDP-2-acetamido-2-deoxy-ribo-hexuluronate aminotransferase
MESNQHRPIQMVDLQSQYLRLKNDIDKAIEKAVRECHYINGPEVRIFSDKLSAFLNSPFTVSCANGTDALQLALMALNLQPGDEIITSAFSFVASAEVIALLKLKPVFADVNPDTFNIDPEEIKKCIGPKTKAILPVHLFGQSADMTAIMDLAQKRNLWVIEDTAQSLGASYSYKGKELQLGTIGHIGCTSFFPSKNLGCFGDGGACFTADNSLAEKMRMISGHGSRNRYYHEVIGINSRLDTLQAAILNVKIAHLNQFIAARREIASIYDSILKDNPSVRIPVIQAGAFHTYNQYTVRVLNNKRNELVQHLEQNGIPTRVYYPLPLHKQKAFYESTSKNSISLPISERLCEEVLSLPMHTELKNEDAIFIAQTITRYLS